VTFKVIWQPAAHDDLAEQWLGASSERRGKITEAAREVELALKHNPQDVGESRVNERRVFFVAPLAVLFEVDEQASVVRILKTWLF
jgi:hypothetical protein